MKPPHVDELRFFVLHALPHLPRHLFLAAGIASLVGERKVRIALCVEKRGGRKNLFIVVAGPVTRSISVNLATCHTVQMNLTCALLAAQSMLCGANVAIPLPRLPRAFVRNVMRLLYLVHIAIVLNP